MYLKALEIQGFKSFPEKTVLNFAEDITAIVGPNGSGKSNISDAIRWVMGEQSAKDLRGAKMEDVIFGGTAKRPQMGFAQVTLVLDNTEHIFPTMDEAEVSVTRRYYRSGESEYYINRQSVRLRDVTELFLDTGMGREGYSIIGQGRIDEILSTRSGDRREVFEEAAGISKYRRRKEESERKLQRTEENLVRVNDKIAELELQVEPLRDQAEKAKKYLVLRDELRLLEISVWLTNLDELKAGARKLEADFRLAKEQRERARQELDALYAAGERCGQQMQEKEMEAERLRTDAAGVDGALGEEDAAVAVLEATIAHQQENLARLEQELSDQADRTGGLERQIAALDERLEQIAQSGAEQGKRLEELLKEAQAAAESAGGAGSLAETLRSREAVALAAAAQARAEEAACSAEDAQMQERLQAVQEEQAGARQELDEAKKEEKADRRALEDARDEVQAAANVIAGHTLKLDERSRRAKEAEDETVRLTLDSGALDNRVRLLREMEREYEGFSKAVRTVMQAKTTLRGIHGPVAELMETDGTYSVAIEIALGAGLQNIVVDREEDAKAAIGYLKRRDAGRATFLPLSAIRGEALRERGVEREYGYVGLASELVRFDERYRGIFLNLLGRTVVVEDLDCGIAIARKYAGRFRIVTLDGQVINRGGSMTGGSVSRNAGVLSRAAELQTLLTRQTSMRQSLETAKAAAETARRELEAARYAVETAQTQRRQAEDEVLRLEGRQNHARLLVQGLEEKLENLAGEAESLHGRLEDHAARRQEIQGRIAEQEQEAERCRAELQKALSGQTEQLARSNELAGTVSTIQAELAALHAEEETTRSRRTDLQELQMQLQGDRDEKERLRAEHQARIASARQEIETHRNKKEQLQARRDELGTQITALNEARFALEAERTAKNRAGQEKNDELLNLEREASRLEQKIAANALEEKQILDRLWERYELSHSDAQAQRQELESIPRANRRIGELKRDIGALGTINIGAIEEFDRVNTRYTYLSEQRDDVARSKEELEGIIQEITEEMTRIFGEQFRLLNESFQTTFRELFGGGQARLELEDEKDILNCGIEIKAQPPGKSLKTISLLSGGEKAFVAIALYFSIIKVHPTPFCVMDEIEAALDDVNVTRYARYMRSITGKTQFIVITHRRGTMEEADVLYGVTMQEQGVSKILTINLNDMAKELKIK